MAAFPGGLPVEKILENDHVIAFHHPAPVYATHLMIVPRTPFRTIQELVRARRELVAEVFAAAVELAEELGLEETGYRIVLNAGEYQDVDVVHFHLVSGRPRDDRL